MSRTSEEIEFWDQRYREGKMPWDASGVPPAFASFMRRAGLPGRALVPGCGSAYEVRALAEAGWQVVGIDFSPAAVETAQRVLGPHAGCVQQVDFFTGEFGSGFDLIYERTFLCSLPTAAWEDYATRVAALLRVGGRLAGLFFHGQEPEPPPYPITDAVAELLFGRCFDKVMDVSVPADQSLPLYAGFERWQEWLRVARPAGGLA
jgi:SAM-dependent methyltransferase